MAASWPAGHAFAFAFLEVSKTDVFHCFSPPGGNQQQSLARWIVHPIVVAPRKNRQQRRTIFISIPRAASRENGAPVPAAPGRAPSHTKHGPPESALICDTDPHGQSARGDSGRAARAPASHR